MILRRHCDTNVQAAIGEWLEKAWQNAKAAEWMASKDRQPTLAVYLTQQSIECAVKGVGLSAGISHANLKRMGHNTLQSFLEFHKIVLEKTQSSSYVDRILLSLKDSQHKAPVDTRIENLLQLVASPKDRKGFTDEQRMASRRFYASARMVTPEEVRNMLGVIQNLRMQRQVWGKAIAIVTEEPMLLKQSDEKFSMESLTQTVKSQTEERLRNSELDVNWNFVEDDLVKEIAKTIAGKHNLRGTQRELKQSNWQYNFTNRQRKLMLLLLFDTPTTFMELLSVGSLVWSHEASTRYPAAPEHIQLSFADAAAKGHLGSNHYSEKAGVVKFVRELARRAKAISSNLKKINKAGYLFTGYQ